MQKLSKFHSAIQKKRDKTTCKEKIKNYLKSTKLSHKIDIYMKHIHIHLSLLQM